MAINRMDASKETPDKPEKGSAPATPAAVKSGGGGAKAWLPLIVTLVVMPVVAYAMTTFVLLPRLQQGLGISASASESPAAKSGHGKPGKEAESKKENAAMNKLLVNVAGSMGSRYLMTSFTLVGSGADFKTRIEKADAQLRDAAGSVLSAKTLADLERAGARNLVRSELISAFNNILGDKTVTDLYITEFAVQ